MDERLCSHAGRQHGVVVSRPRTTADLVWTPGQQAFACTDVDGGPERLGALLGPALGLPAAG
jgi:hypothetical protein